MENKFSRKQINSIGEAYRQITEDKTSVSNSSSASSSIDMGLGGKGTPGLGPDGKSNFVGKPNITTGKPTGKGNKKAGYGFEVPTAVYGTIVKTIKDAGIKFNENDPLSISRALNNAKGKKQQEVVDKVAKEFGLTIDRKEILSDIQKAFELLADYNREWAKKADAHEKKLNDAKVKVTKALWMNPRNRTVAAVDAVAKWREQRMGTNAGESPGTARSWIFPILTGPNPHTGVEMIKDILPINDIHTIVKGVGDLYGDSDSDYDDWEIGTPGKKKEDIWLGVDGILPNSPHLKDDDPQGAQSPRDKRINNVKNTLEIQKQEKEGLYTNPIKNKNPKIRKLAKKYKHPKWGTSDNIIIQGTKEYDKLKDKLKGPGYELFDPKGDYGDYESYRSIEKPGGHHYKQPVNISDPTIPYEDFPRPGETAGPDVVEKPGRGSRIEWSNRRKRFTRTHWDFGGNAGLPDGGGNPFDGGDAAGRGTGVTPTIKTVVVVIGGIVLTWTLTKILGEGDVPDEDIDGPSKRTETGTGVRQWKGMDDSSGDDWR